MNHDFSPTGAARAAQQGKLADWVNAFLRGPGDNVPFADGLKLAERTWTCVPAQRLDVLCRICGPEEGLPFPVPREAFETRLRAMARALAAGWEPPPLIVYAPDLSVNDGNHRLETLRRAGRTTYSTLLWSTVQDG